jgi:hypothetical protein
MTLHLYLVSVIGQHAKYLGYDSYDSFVCCCENEEDARRIHPSMDPSEDTFNDEEMCWIQTNGIKRGKYKEGEKNRPDSWVYGKDIHIALKVELLGTAKKGSKKDIVLASYNAG